MSRPQNTDDNLAYIAERYSPARSQAARQVERAALGHEVGLNGYTTVEQAQILSDYLQLAPSSCLLDLGAGRGWPGSHIAQSNACCLVSSDVPWDALVEARANIESRGILGTSEVVAADGRALPFRAGHFDAIVHADVFC